jgi:hypothetical protein
MFRNFMLAVLLCVGTLGVVAAQQTDTTAQSSASQSAAVETKTSVAKATAAAKEDFTQMAADRNQLKMRLAGAVLSKVDTPGCTRELIRVEWRRGDPIDIYVMKPHSAGKPRVALYLYSFPFDIDRFRDNAWCERNTRDGLAAVGFTSALTGQRYHSRPMKEWFVSELQESMGTSVHDVQLLLDYLGSRGDLQTDHVGMFGQGSGGAIALIAAAVDARIQAVDVLNPWGDWPDWLKTSPIVPDEERARYLTPAFLEKAALVDPILFLPKLKDREVRIQQVMDEPDTPAEVRAKFAEAAPAGDVAAFKDKAAHRESYNKLGLSGWLAGQLGVKSEGAATASAPATAKPGVAKTEDAKTGDAKP